MSSLYESLVINSLQGVPLKKEALSYGTEKVTKKTKIIKSFNIT